MLKTSPCIHYFYTYYYSLTIRMFQKLQSKILHCGYQQGLANKISSISASFHWLPIKSPYSTVFCHAPNAPSLVRPWKNTLKSLWPQV